MEETAGQPFISPRPCQQHATTLLLRRASKRDVHDAVGVVGKILIAKHVLNKVTQGWCLRVDVMRTEGTLCDHVVDECAFIAGQARENE